jgi:hypothetical protein
MENDDKPGETKKKNLTNLAIDRARKITMTKKILQVAKSEDLSPKYLCTIDNESALHNRQRA